MCIQTGKKKANPPVLASSDPIWGQFDGAQSKILGPRTRKGGKLNEQAWNFGHNLREIQSSGVIEKNKQQNKKRVCGDAFCLSIANDKKNLRHLTIVSGEANKICEQR